MYIQERANTPNPKYVGKRFTISRSDKAQGHCGHDVIGKEMIAVGATRYAEDDAWVWGYLPDERHGEGQIVEIGLPSKHLVEVEENASAI